MSEHDLDLIIELISGRLSPDERDAALARIVSDPALQSEYEVQLATASLLRDLPAPTMTGDERSTLHASLREQLNLDGSAPLVLTPAPSRWQRWWAPASALAAAAAVIVGVIVILPEGGSDDSFEPVAAVMSETTEASRLADTPAGGATDSEGAPSDEAATTTAAAAEAAPEASTTAVAEETTTTAAGSADGLAAYITMGALPHLPDQDLDEIALAYGDGSGDLVSLFDASTPDDAAVDLEGGEACLNEAAVTASPSVVTPVATTTVEGADAIVLAVAPPDGETYFVVFDIATCRELASTRS